MPAFFTHPALLAASTSTTMSPAPGQVVELSRYHWTLIGITVALLLLCAVFLVLILRWLMNNLFRD
ncbi:MAG: hypothetical protein Q4A31_11340 [Corynebacterium sp.]|uniref:hypothetical protein n=1 Tax=Corynebacterium sp. TaxID=1720 RepID=UPI0026DD453C|nr:hypothetical protein [Corynebacterium sp.]MDO4762505.1 hypothetical protein [Corynebacterium sp.]